MSVRVCLNSQQSVICYERTSLIACALDLIAERSTSAHVVAVIFGFHFLRARAKIYAKWQRSDLNTSQSVLGMLSP